MNYNLWKMMIEYLIARGADTTLRNRDGNTPIHIAIMNRKYDAIRALAESGKTIFASIKLGTFVTLIVCFLIWLCFISKNGTETNLGSIILALIVFLSIIILILMQVFDLIAFGFGIYSDGNGVALS